MNYIQSIAINCSAPQNRVDLVVEITAISPVTLPGRFPLFRLQNPRIRKERPLSEIPKYMIGRKRVAAGALLVNTEQRILLVNPTYKPQWEIPGGMVEEAESPLAACRREVLEEIGLAIHPGPLLSVGYLRDRGRGDALRFVFWGGVLDEIAISQIRLPVDELSEYRFVTLAEAGHLLLPTLHAQVAQALQNLQGRQQVYWEETSDA